MTCCASTIFIPAAGATSALCWVRLMRSPDEFCGPVKLGNPVECTMLELAAMVVDLTGSRSGIEFRPAPSDDPARRRPDIALARRWLGWEPKVEMEEGLSRTIAYFRALRAARGLRSRAAGIVKTKKPPQGRLISFLDKWGG